jgi:hypothetical protein
VGETEFNERWENIIGYNFEELLPVNVPTWLAHSHFNNLKESGRLLNEQYAVDAIYYIF